MVLKIHQQAIFSPDHNFYVSRQKLFISAEISWKYLRKYIYSSFRKFNKVREKDNRVIFFTQAKKIIMSRGRSRTAATSKIERFVIIVNGLQPLTIITKRSILDAAAALDPRLTSALRRSSKTAFF